MADQIRKVILTGLAIILFNFLYPSTGLAAQPAQKPSTGKIPEAGTAPQNNNKASDQVRPLEVQIETSKVHPCAGSSLHVTIKIRNISDSPVQIDTKNCQLLFPPELSRDESIAQTFIFFAADEQGLLLLGPGDETCGLSTVQSNSSAAGSRQSDASEAFTTASQKQSQILSNLWFWDFTPGDYKLHVIIPYLTDPQQPNSPPVHHFLTETAVISFIAPQTVLLLGAAIGGAIAFALFLYKSLPEQNPQWTYWALSHIGKFGSAMLLACIITILLARISETQFLIRVTINDIWGAVAIGFIGAYGGKRLVDKLIQKSSEADEKNKIALNKDATSNTPSNSSTSAENLNINGNHQEGKMIPAEAPGAVIEVVYSHAEITPLPAKSEHQRGAGG